VKVPLLGSSDAGDRDIPGDSVSPAALRGRTIVVVDDDADGCELVAEVLRRSGARVVASGSVEDALLAFHENHPDVIVSDIGMPYFDGYELIRRIRQLPAVGGGQVAVIAVSGLGGNGLQAKALRGGFQAYVPKPIEPPILVNAILGLVSHEQ